MIDTLWVTNYGLIGLFLVNFLAYTIIPLPVEAAIILATFFNNPLTVLVVAMIGSTLGSITCFYLGYKGIRTWLIKNKKEFKYDVKARKLFNKYGSMSILLFGWLPFIGDPLIILAGTLEMKFWKFLAYSVTGRLIYFVIIIGLGEGIEGLFYL